MGANFYSYMELEVNKSTDVFDIQYVNVNCHHWLTEQRQPIFHHSDHTIFFEEEIDVCVISTVGGAKCHHYDLSYIGIT